MTDILGVMYGKYYSMAEKPNTLQDYVRRSIAEKGLTYREVANRSRKLISHSTVYDIINGRNHNPTLRTIRGLAYGLGVSEQEIRAIAEGKELNFDEVIALLPYEFQELSEDQKKEIRPTLEMVINDIRRRLQNNELPSPKT